MELYQLRSFVAVAREGNLTRAAGRLFASQPTVSAHIKTLEDEFGLRLFERGPRGMTLTEAGRALLEDAHAVLQAHRGLQDRATSLRGEIRGNLKIGFVSDPEVLKLTALLHWMTAHHPGVALHLRKGVSGQVREEILNGVVDGGYIIGPVREMQLATMRLRDLVFRLAIPAAWHPQVESHGWPALLAQPWVLTGPQSFCKEMAETLFLQQGTRPPKTLDVDDESTSCQLIAAGMGAGLLREEKAQSLAETGQVFLWPEARHSAALHFAYRRDRERDPLVQAVLTGLREIHALPPAASAPDTPLTAVEMPI